MVSEKVTDRVMKEDASTVGYPKNQRRYCSYRGDIDRLALGVVQRNFHADAPGTVWLTDITEFAAQDGRVYL